MGFSRQECWSGLHSLLQGIFPTQVSALQAGSLPSEPPGKQYRKRILNKSLGLKQIRSSSVSLTLSFKLLSPQSQILPQPKGKSILCCSLVAQLCESFATLWTVAHQAPLSMGSPRQEYWRGLPFPSPGNLPNPVIKPASPASAGGFLTTATREASAGSSLGLEN